MQKDTIVGCISILKDIELEARTSLRDLEHGDPMIESMDYIKDLASTCIEKLIIEQAI